MTHEEITSVMFLKDPFQNVIAIDGSEKRKPELVFAKGSVSPNWCNLLRSSQLMYFQLSELFIALQTLIDESEALTGETALSQTFENMQNAILITQQAARNGVEETAKLIERSK